jgi:ATP-dependent DNA ligase
LLFRRRREPCVFAFDLLYLNGNDCRCDSLAQRKPALGQLLNCGVQSGVTYVDALDLDRVMAKHKDSPYLSEKTISS